MIIQTLKNKRKKTQCTNIKNGNEKGIPKLL